MTTKPRGKALKHEQNERLRQIVRDLVDKDFAGNTTAASRALGVTQPLLSELLAGGRGAGPKLIQGLADYTGRSTDDLYGRPLLPLPPGGYQTLGQHPDFAKALEEAAARPGRLVRRAQLEAVGTVALSKPPEHLTADFIVRMAEALATAEPFDDPET